MLARPWDRFRPWGFATGAPPGRRSHAYCERVQRFPKLSLEPNEYDAVWRVDGHPLPGKVALLEEVPPRGEIYDDTIPPEGASFPKPEERARLRGHLRRGDDIVLGDVALSTWFPGHRTLNARWAVVGMGLDRVPDLAFTRARLQVSGLDTFFGVAPIKSRGWPVEPIDEDQETFSATSNPESNLSWEAEGVRVIASYDCQFAFADVYQQLVQFAPVLTIEVETPLSVDDWVERWVRPLVRFVTFATNAQQNLSWVSLSWDGEGEPSASSEPVNAQLFGSGMSQVGYGAAAPALRSKRPLLTLAGLQTPFPDLVERWRALDEDENVFFALFRMVISQPELPNRARYLFLVQALESLHGVEHQAEDEASQTAFQTDRKRVLTELDEVGLNTDSLRFIKKNWSKRRPDSLARRLRDLIAWLPQVAADEVQALASTSIANYLEECAGQELDVETLLQGLRNELSHGNSHWDEGTVAPWSDALELACRLHVLRLLGFDNQQIEEVAIASR